MKIREIAKKVCVVITVVAVTMYYSGFSVGTVNDVKATERKAKIGRGTEYIVGTSTKDALSKIRKEHEESTEINGNEQGCLEDNLMLSVKLSESELTQIKEENSVRFVEEDVMVEGSSRGNKSVLKEKHEKRQKINKKNSSSDEWNVRMVNADKIGNVKGRKKGKRIKIALLDSGVDCGNDISLAYSVSLVPGEEEMTKVFMDGSGHGSSVASLIAAEDNGEGITGINPNAEIYSIRVLDDANQAPISRVIEGIYMAIEKKVNIINMSFGVDTYSKALQKAVQDATEAGILIVAAAGNTGQKGVQYPAAYDEVVAVGSVDKEGKVVEDSARGDEIELVAPGELVRTTGFLGTEMVTAGTSLAAPQVSAVASLIWEKDPNASADFVRRLLNESSNLYGDATSYGNGLIDVQYALSHYDELKRQYKVNNTDLQGGQFIEENDNKIETFQDTGCVEGCWNGGVHTDMIASGYFSVRQGVRFPDTEKYDDGSYRFSHMSANPWWHGFYRETNYIKAVIYAARMGDAIKKYGKGKQWQAVNPDYNDSTYMRADINFMDDKGIWAKEISRMKARSEYSTNSKAQAQKDTVGFRRAFVWGMAIHAATDIFAHSVMYKGEWIDHTTKVNGVDRADSTEVCTARFHDAQKVAQQIMKRYIAGDELRVVDLLPPEQPTDYKIYDLYTFVNAADSSVSYKVTGYSCSSSTK